MKFLIRDDDTCAFTDPSELVRCYERIWDHAPVGLSVTPFRVPGNYHSVPESFRSIDKPLPLEGNREIVAFLKEMQAAGKVEVLMHGYDHTLPRGLPEYIGGTDLRPKTLEGKAYLEDLLGCRLDTFVPPNNGILRAGMEAVIAAGLNVVAMPSLLKPSHRPVGPENLLNFIKVSYFKRIRKMAYPYVLHFGDHKELSYHSITPSQSLDHLLDAFEKCAAADGVFVAAIHYCAFESRLKSGETLRRALDILLDRAAGLPGIHFSTFHKVWNPA